MDWVETRQSTDERRSRKGRKFGHNTAVEHDMRLDRKDRASLLVLPKEEELQHNDIHCPLPEDKDDGTRGHGAGMAS